MILGILGVLLVAAAWVPQTIHTIRTKQKVNLTFNIMYVLGSILLLLYSLQIQDTIFLLLNGVALLLSLMNLLYSFRIK